MDRNIIVRIVKEFPVDRRSLPNIAEYCRILPNRSEIRYHISNLDTRSESDFVRIFSILPEFHSLGIHTLLVSTVDDALKDGPALSNSWKRGEHARQRELIPTHSHLWSTADVLPAVREFFMRPFAVT